MGHLGNSSSFLVVLDVDQSHSNGVLQQCILICLSLCLLSLLNTCHVSKCLGELILGEARGSSKLLHRRLLHCNRLSCGISLRDDLLSSDRCDSVEHRLLLLNLLNLLLHGLLSHSELLEHGLKLVHLRLRGYSGLGDSHRLSGESYLGLLDDLVTEEASHEVCWLLSGHLLTTCNCCS